jgi:methylenetetrahydrofolate reductase (NADPH)
MLTMRRWSVRHAGLVERLYEGLMALLRRLRPLARHVGAERLAKPVTLFERATKGFLFDCRMCGVCVLSTNGMSCPMNCPKQVRNGPCGGVRADGTCEARPEMQCVGLEAWRGAARMKVGGLSEAVNAPAERHLAGSSSWLQVVRTEGPPTHAALEAVVQPSGSRLQALLSTGTFTVTAEFPPPDSADPADVDAGLQPFRGCVDALNVTDAAGANCHMSSVAASVLLAQAGCEPVVQMTGRDRNRIAIQGDLLGASALGLRNVLCLTGDHVSNGDHPGAAQVGDLDGVTLLATARKMRDAGEFLSGRSLKSAPRFFLGAAGNPFSGPVELRVARLRRKIAAGAQFIQTQYCFDIERLDHFMRLVRAEGLQESVSILVGVGPLASAKTARWMRANVPGVRIPDAIIERLEQASDPREEGRRICIELIRAVRDIPGVAGVHIMAHRQERMVRSIVEESGALAGRAALFAAPKLTPVSALGACS